MIIIIILKLRETLQKILVTAYTKKTTKNSKHELNINSAQACRLVSIWNSIEYQIEINVHKMEL